MDAVVRIKEGLPKMPGPTPIAVDRSLRALGNNIASWRKLQRLTTEMVAERAGISRGTLRALEQGKGTVSLENTLRVLRVLGVMDPVVRASDPLETDLGKLRAAEPLPRRVRS